MISVIIIVVLCVIIASLLLVNEKESKFLNQVINDQKEDYNKLLSQKKSSEVRLGQISENLAPFLKDFKYNPKETHFIGMPIDYIIFEEDKVVFLEVKSGQSQLSTKQRKIRNLINDGKVEWDEMRIN